MKSQTCSAYYVLPVSNPASLIPKFHSNTVLQALSVTVTEQTILQGNRKDEDQPTHRQPRAHHRQVGRALQYAVERGHPAYLTCRAVYVPGEAEFAWFMESDVLSKKVNIETRTILPFFG